MNTESMAFLPGLLQARVRPLARYLPPLPAGAGTTWLESRLPTAEAPWVLDPFGASPELAIEAARAGYRVLAAVNNPIMRFLYEMLAAPPTREALQGAIAALAAARRGDERLEPHLRALYRTECAECSREVEAEAYVWDRGAEAPVARIYNCPFCGDSGERPSTEGDAIRAAQFGTAGLHRARALERVAAKNDPNRQHVEEALEVYPPRAVYVLFTLINKLEGLEGPGAPPLRRRWLEALLISALDAANTLWPYPTSRARPRQLTVPRRYLERNPWLALEAAVDEWAAGETDTPIPIIPWPHPLPPGGGICLFEGRMKDLADEHQARHGLDEHFAAVLTALPRPNQAFWTLSALWSGWLWGRQAVEPFKVALRRRRYDWGWHATALSAAFGHLSGLLEPEAPVLGIIGEAEPGFLSAALLAAARSGFSQTGLALRVVPRAENSGAQIAWQRRQVEEPTGPRSQEDVQLPIRAPVDTPGDVPVIGTMDRRRERGDLWKQAQAAARLVLRQRGEPAPYLLLHTAALQELTSDPEVIRTFPEEPDEALDRLQDIFKNAFTIQGVFTRFGGSPSSLEAGLWWLPKILPAQEKGGQQTVGNSREDSAQNLALPLADRVEMAVVRALQKNAGGISFSELDAALCAAFPGFLTPSQDVIRACLGSYATPQKRTNKVDPDLGDPDHWQLRSADAADARRTDLGEVKRLLEITGRRMGWKVQVTQEEFPRYNDSPRRERVEWHKQDGEVYCIFYPVASAVVGDLLPAPPFPPERCILVYPGSRAGLLRFKLERDPRLRAALETGWRTVKFRHLRRLAENEGLTLDTFEEQLSLDPPEVEGGQLPLF